jgi:hypothetical protein
MMASREMRCFASHLISRAGERAMMTAAQSQSREMARHGGPHHLHRARVRPAEEPRRCALLHARRRTAPGGKEAASFSC